MCRCTPPIWISISSIFVIALITYGVTVIPVMGTQWHSRVLDLCNSNFDNVRKSTIDNIDENIEFNKLASSSVGQLEHLIQQGTIPDSNYDPIILVRLFNALETSNHKFNSIGMLMESPSNPGGKVSWQVVQGFGYGCSKYMYAYCDPSIYPVFYGYCIDGYGNMDSIPTYTGMDWGLKPSEKQMLDGQYNSTFLDIFYLEGQFMITYNLAYYLNPSLTNSSITHNYNKPYVVLFGEESLETLNEYILSISIFNGKGILYMMEHNTGNLISVNIENIMRTGSTRISAINGTNITMIKETAPTIFSTKKYGNYDIGDYRVGVSSYTDSNSRGINWDIIIVAPKSVVYDKLAKTTKVVISISVVVLIVTIFITILAVYLLVVKRLKIINKRLEKLTKQNQSPDSNGLLSTRDDFGDLYRTIDAMEEHK